MIECYGSSQLNPLYVADDARRNQLLQEAAGLPSVVISSAAAGNAVMLAAGYFNPLTGFMNLAEAQSVAEKMALPSGLFWPVPILNLVPGGQAIESNGSGRIALLDPNVEGNPVLAIQTVTAIEKISQEQKEAIARHVYGTNDGQHPGVATFMGAGDTIISGPIEVLNYSYFSTEFPGTFRTATQIREMIAKNNWNKVVAFQTRNPMHLAHEQLCRIAQKTVGADGILIHMLLGKLKPGDIPADVRDAAIRKMVDLYFPENTVLITGYGFDMLYAGPREALLHAVFRQNAGATHFIIGRDHAGVGDYYGAFDAQTIFDQIPPDALKIEIFRGDHTVWCFKCQEVVMMRDCPHGKEDYLLLSGTKVREMLSRGEELPKEFARPEVAKILSEFYQSQGK
ncbi:MAG: sulfate adenylyltransferase [Deltaproteobacteria bacterium]|nr:sulfate adenylyltransferase [Deltaproteobacteria bacterium]